MPRVTEALRVERTRRGGLGARVTLARPEGRNAFDASLIAELRATFAALERDSPTDLRAVVLAGEGETFCAGADIDWMRAAMQLDVEGNEQDSMAMAEMFETIDTCPIPPPSAAPWTRAITGTAPVSLGRNIPAMAPRPVPGIAPARSRDP